MIKEKIQIPFIIYEPTYSINLVNPYIRLVIRTGLEEWWYVLNGDFQAASIDGELYLRKNTLVNRNTRLQNFLGCKNIRELRREISLGHIHEVEFIESNLYTKRFDYSKSNNLGHSRKENL